MTSTGIMALIRKLVDIWVDLEIANVRRWNLDMIKRVLDDCFIWYREQKLAEERVKAAARAEAK